VLFKIRNRRFWQDHHSTPYLQQNNSASISTFSTFLSKSSSRKLSLKLLPFEQRVLLLELFFKLLFPRNPTCLRVYNTWGWTDLTNYILLIFCKIILYTCSSNLMISMSNRKKDLKIDLFIIYNIRAASHSLSHIIIKMCGPSRGVSVSSSFNL
jgi:hypothetical protein